jgi:L-rhamnose isomerase
VTWFSEVTKDLARLPDALDHFENEYWTAAEEVKIRGNLEKAAASMPGVVEQRFNQLQEIEAILNHLNIQLRKIKSKHFKKYLENYQRALSSRDVEKYVDGEDEVVDYETLVNEVALMRNRWLGIIKALDQKQWQITNITKLRVAGMEDASL